MHERVAADGTRLRWRDEGDGTPLLLLTGLGATSVAWDPLTAHMTTQHRMLLPENRGALEDDGSHGELTLAQLADDAVGALDAAGIRTAHVAGNSLGGMIAQELALRHPDRVRSLILAATSPGVPCVPASPLFAWHMARAATSSGGTRERHLAACFLGRHAATSAPCEEGGLARLRITEGHRRQLRAALRWSALRRLHRLAVPTLVLHGADDRLLPPMNARLLARLIPNARLHLLPGAGHFFISEAAAPAAAAIDLFLAAVETAPAPTAPARSEATFPERWQRVLTHVTRRATVTRGALAAGGALPA